MDQADPKLQQWVQQLLAQMQQQALIQQQALNISERCFAKCVPKAPLLAAGRARQVLNERRALQQSGGSHPFVPLLHGLLDASERLALSTRPG